MTTPVTAPSSVDFLGVNSSRGGRIVAWDNLPIGSKIEGIVAAEPKVVQQTNPTTRQPAFFPPDPDTGRRDPIFQMLITIDTGAPDPAMEGDDGMRTLAIRGGFKYESSKKALTDALKPHGLAITRVGDYVSQTRLPNRPSQGGMSGRTHQFSMDYDVAENLTGQWKVLSDRVLGGGSDDYDEDEAQAAPTLAATAAPKKRAARKPAAAPAPATTEVVAEDPWDN